jgi:holo-[acyl-carrier protein] synthase
VTVVGIGVDLVDTARFRTALARSPRLEERVFSPREREQVADGPGRAASLAARWAAKEAVAKVLVDCRGLSWHDCEVLAAAGGAPRLHVSGTVQAAAAAAGIGGWHLSLSHDGDMAIAFVVAVSSPPGMTP